MDISLITDYLHFKKFNYMPFPQVIQIELTKYCPLHCPYCYKDNDGTMEIPFHFLKEFLPQIAKHGVRRIMLNGGEPLLYSEIERTLDLLHYCGLKANCFTSGIGLNDQLIRSIMNSHIDLSISLNGSTEKVNCQSRDGFTQSINSLKMLRKFKSENTISYGISWIARHDNVYDFRNMVSMAKEYNADWIIIGCNKLNHSGTTDSIATYEDLKDLSEIVKNLETHDNPRILIEECFSQLILLSDYFPRHKLMSGCMAGRGVCYVNVHGKYAPCTHLNYYEQFESIEEYWRSSQILRKIRTVSPTSDCVDCGYSEICNPCKALSLYIHDHFVADPNTCILNKKEIRYKNAVT